jgi:hypothetical protein
MVSELGKCVYTQGEFTKQPLDAILDFLAKSFMSAEDLQVRIRQVFRNLDIDRSGSISYVELMEGVHRSDPDSGLRLTEEDFFEITDGGTLLSEGQVLDFTQFNIMILKRLRAYLQRKSAEAVLHMANPVEVEAMLLNSKFLMVETNLISNLVQASAEMHVQSGTQNRQDASASSLPCAPPHPAPPRALPSADVACTDFGGRGEEGGGGVYLCSKDTVEGRSAPAIYMDEIKLMLLELKEGQREMRAQMCEELLQVCVCPCVCLCVYVRSCCRFAISFSLSLSLSLSVSVCVCLCVCVSVCLCVCVYINKRLYVCMYRTCLMC